MSAREQIRCCDGCGATATDTADAMARAWTILQITGRYRCPACVRALATVNLTDTQVQGADSTMGALR